MGGNARRRRKAARKDISNIEDSGANLIDRKLTGLEVKSAMQGISHLLPNTHSFNCIIHPN